MIKRRPLLIFGVFILVLTMSLVILNKESLFNEAYREGRTVITFDIINNNNKIKFNRIEKIILENTGLEKNDIEIESNEKSLTTRFTFVEKEVVERITNSVIMEYKDELRFAGHHRIEKSQNSRGNFLLSIYPTLFLIFVVLVLIIIGFILFKSIKKYFRSQ
jgi:hypothetical protein